MAVNIQSNFQNMVLSGNEVLVQASSSLTGALYEQVTIYLTVVINTIEQEIALEVDHENKVLFDISFALKQLLEYNKAIPSIFNIIYCNVGAIKYSLKAREKYWNTTTQAYVFTSSQDLVTNYFAIDGGYDLKKENEAYLKSLSFNTEYKINRKFLTNINDKQTVSFYQPISIYFIESDNSNDKFLRFTLTKKSKSTGSESDSIHIFFYSDYDVPGSVNQLLFTPYFLFYQFQTGYVGTHELLKISLETHNGIEYSTPRIWNVEDYVFAEKKFITFRNSLGGYDSIELKGEDQQLLSKKDLLINTRKTQEETGEFRVSQLKTAFKHEFKNNIGNIADEDISWLIDLFISDDVYIVNIEGTEYNSQKIIIDSQNIINKDNLNLDYLYNFPVKYTSANAEMYYNESIGFARKDPPYYFDLTDWYSLRKFDTLKGILNNATISIESTVEMITIPISHFNFSSTIFWTDSVRLESWYDSASPNKCPLSFLTEANINTHAQQFFKERTFLNYYTPDASPEDILPILCYNNAVTNSVLEGQIISYINQY